MATVSAFFVYGTLKRGQANYPLIAPYVRAVEPAVARGQLFDHGPFPALVAGEGRVRGELVALDPADLEAALPIVDRLEDFRPNDPAGSMYLRQVVEVETAGGGRSRAYAYFYNRDPGDLRSVVSGEWAGPSAGREGDGEGELTAFRAHVRGFLGDSGAGDGRSGDV
jgi:gamma-glutamylcyclotransferase (GGCT)/AIG2-like uncharacterized protein YtfP